MGNLTKRTGFSLIEIVIAISLVAIFVTLPSLAFTNYLKQSRDEKRKSDVNKIQSALEAYKAENGVYPEDLDVLVEEGYMSEIPEDPMQGQEVPGTNGTEQFGYQYNLSPDGLSYELSSRLEETSVGGPGGSGGGGSSGGGGANGAGDIYIVTPKGPKTITNNELLSATPTAPLPTRTITPTPTTIISITTTPTPTPPSCNQTVTCSGSCQTLANRCGSYTSTQTGCTYTTRSGGGSCSPAPAPDQSCTASSSCTPGWTCSGTNCLSPTPTPLPPTATPTPYALVRQGNTMSQNQTLSDVSAASGNGFLVAGSENTCCDTKGVIARLNSSGTQQWVRTFKLQYNSYQSSVSLNSAIEATDGSIYGAGTAQISSSGLDVNAVVVKFNSAGTMQWATGYLNSYGSIARDIIQTSDGNFVIVGTVSYPGATNLVRGDAMVLKINSSGTQLWKRQHGSAPEADYDEYHEVIETSDGGLLAVGSTSTFSMITRMDSSGNILWTRTVPSSGATGVEEMSDGSISVMLSQGTTEGHVILRLTSGGLFSWARFYKPSSTFDQWEPPTDLARSANDDLSFGVSSAYGAVAIRVNSSGTVLWGRRFGPAGGQGCLDDPMYCYYTYEYNSDPSGVASINGGSAFVSTYFQREESNYYDRYYLANYTSAGSIPGTCTMNNTETITSGSKSYTIGTLSTSVRTPGTSTATFSYINVPYSLTWTNSCN